MYKIIGLLFMAALLSGCESLYANLIQDYNDTRGLTRNYIAQNVATRQWVRNECQVELQLELQQLRADGKHAEARALLREVYPPAVTSAVLDDYRDEAAAIHSTINIPHVCGTGE